MRLFVQVIFVTSLSFLLSCGGGGTTDASSDGAAGSGASGSSSDICGEVADSSEVVAEAGGFSVTQLEWDAELLSIPARARARYDNDKGRQDIAERVLLNKAMFAEADKMGLLDDPKVVMSARRAAEKAYITALLAQVESSAADDAAVDAYYQENIDKYSRPMVRARHILVKDEALAADLSAQLEAGGDFAAAGPHRTQHAHTSSGKAAGEGDGQGGGGSSKSKGGELPWATRDRWVPEFADAAFSLEPGQRSAAVQSKFGYHIIEVLEKREVQPLEEVRPGIERVLTRNAVRDFRDGVKTELGIGKTPASRARPPAGAGTTGGSPEKLEKLEKPEKPGKEDAPEGGK